MRKPIILEKSGKVLLTCDRVGFSLVSADGKYRLTSATTEAEQIDLSSPIYIRSTSLHANKITMLTSSQAMFLLDSIKKAPLDILVTLNGKNLTDEIIKDLILNSLILMQCSHEEQIVLTPCSSKNLSSLRKKEAFNLEIKELISNGITNSLSLAKLEKIKSLMGVSK